MRVAIYARVSMPRRILDSTDETVTRSKQEVANQLLQLRKFCGEQDWQIVAEYIDHRSGKDSERPGFKDMFKGAEAHQFDLLLFWALDRVSREGALPTLHHLDRLQKFGVKFRSFTEPYIDTLGPFGDAIIALLGALAQQERQRISERTKAGLERAAAQGRHGGRRTTIVYDPGTIAVLADSGISVRSLATRLGCSKSHAARLLTRAKTDHNPNPGLTKIVS